jgi:transcription elongation GreA/GreB family factor
MAKMRKKTAEDIAFDERTKMINDRIAELRKRVEAKKAAEDEQREQAQSG